MSLVSVERINDDYEYIQYNEHLRLIHSVKDDMYQMQSIIKACDSKKPCKDWFGNQSTQEILDEIARGGIPPLEKAWEIRDNLPVDLRGYYVHRLFVNHIAMWASPRYCIYIMELLDNYFKRLRKQQEQKIEELKTRAVLENNKNYYRYLIWKEDSDKENFTRLHLVRRHKNTWRRVKDHQNNDVFFFKNDLPISMTPNLNIKKIIKASFGSNDYKILNSGNVVDIKTEHLPFLHELIEQYFEKNLRQ